MEKIIDLQVRFSKHAELERVLRCLKMADWYKENGYKVKVPKGLAMGKTYSRDRVARALEAEFRKDDYEEWVERVTASWKKVTGRFVRALVRDGIRFRNEYSVQLTKYGTRGSYNPPKGIIVNIDREDMDISRTLRHEIVHLIIHKDIERCRVSHWNKERIVDLICRKVIGRDYSMQTISFDPKVDGSFKKYYPDLPRVIREIAAGK